MNDVNVGSIAGNKGEVLTLIPWGSFPENAIKNRILVIMANLHEKYRAVAIVNFFLQM